MSVTRLKLTTYELTILHDVETAVNRILRKLRDSNELVYALSVYNHFLDYIGDVRSKNLLFMSEKYVLSHAMEYINKVLLTNLEVESLREFNRYVEY